MVTPVRVPPRLILVAPSAGEVAPVPSVAPVGNAVPIEAPVVGFAVLLEVLAEAGLEDEPVVLGTPVCVGDNNVGVMPPVEPSELTAPVVFMVEELADEAPELDPVAAGEVTVLAGWLT